AVAVEDAVAGFPVRLGGVVPDRGRVAGGGREGNLGERGVGDGKGRVRGRVGRAQVNLEHRLDGGRGLHRLVPGDLAKEGVLLQVRQQEGAPAPARRRVRVGGGGEVAGRERPAGVVVLVAGEADLLQVVGALAAGGGLPHFLHGRHQEADEDGDDGD